jgi:hypothetical protein
MNRKNLTAAVLAGLAGVVGIAGSAQAVNVNPDGTGQVLLYPYYTTNAGNITLLSVVNTSDISKAVKVRFLESENSQEVLDFNLYLSAYDVWTAAISPMPEDAEYDDCDLNLNDNVDVFCKGPLLTVAPDETTCTVPMLNGAQPFLPFQYLGDKGTKADSRMNEGHFEMIEMGTLGWWDSEGVPHETWAGEAATHVTHKSPAGWYPEDCGLLVEAWTRSVPFFVATSGDWIKDPTNGVEAPSGGLFGGASIVNVGEGAMHTYDATALNGWNETGFDTSGEISIHAEPGTVKPSLGSGDVHYGYVFSENGMPLESGYLSANIDAVSYVLMHDTLMNEYTTETGVAGQTEWVITFPTKKFYVDPTTQPLAPVRPFTTAWAPVPANSTTIPATACETVELRTLWDREERTEPAKTCEELDNCPGTKPPVVSPPRPGQPPEVDAARIPFELCYETNVIRFGAAYEVVDGEAVDILPASTELLGTPMPKYRNIDNAALGFQYGWARIDMDDYEEAIPFYDENNDLAGYTYAERSRWSIGSVDPLNGLPFVGFAATRFTNGFIPGEEGNVLSAYGGLFKHKSSRKVGSDSGSY